MAHKKGDKQTQLTIANAQYALKWSSMQPNITTKCLKKEVYFDNNNTTYLNMSQSLQCMPFDSFHSIIYHFIQLFIISIDLIYKL